METRKEIAVEKKRCGSHNCTQAVLCTYHDFAGMEEEAIKNVGDAFAAGMGNMEGTCGALVRSRYHTRTCHSGQGEVRQGHETDYG